MNPVKKAKSVIKESKNLTKLLELDLNSKSVWEETDGILYDTLNKLKGLLPDQDTDEDTYNKLMVVINAVEKAQGALSNYL